jgi:large subunit ribosomal protein L6
MSRIGKKQISLPDGVNFSVSSDNTVTVKGPKGELTQKVDQDLTVELSEGSIVVSRPTEQKRHKAMHGLYRTLIYNMVVGVTTGFEKKLELIGVGYKADSNGQVLELSLGFSHQILVVLPSEIKVETETKKGLNPKITLTSHDKQLIGHFAAKIRGLRPPEPYKGKGVRFVGEYVRRKAGKSAAKK